MVNSSLIRRVFVITALATVFAAVTRCYADASDESSAPTAMDRAAARTAKSRHHAQPAHPFAHHGAAGFTARMQMESS